MSSRKMIRRYRIRTGSPCLRTESVFEVLKKLVAEACRPAGFTLRREKYDWENNGNGSSADRHTRSAIFDRKAWEQKEFREVIGEIAQLMCYEATRDLKTEEVTIRTPLAEMKGRVLSGKKLAIIPILRAGLGMVDGMLSLIPAAKVGHIGLYRDPETLEPVEYYCKLPEDCEEREVFVVDPMLATGGSSSAAIPNAEGERCEKHPFPLHYRGA